MLLLHFSVRLFPARGPQGALSPAASKLPFSSMFALLSAPYRGLQWHHSYHPACIPGLGPSPSALVACGPPAAALEAAKLQQEKQALAKHLPDMPTPPKKDDGRTGGPSSDHLHFQGQACCAGGGSRRRWSSKASYHAACECWSHAVSTPPLAALHDIHVHAHRQLAMSAGLPPVRCPRAEPGSPVSPPTPPHTPPPQALSRPAEPPPKAPALSKPEQAGPKTPPSNTPRKALPRTKPPPAPPPPPPKPAQVRLQTHCWDLGSEAVDKAPVMHGAGPHLWPCKDACPVP